MNTTCGRCEVLGRAGVPADVAVDGVDFCLPCSRFYKEDVQRKAAENCENNKFHWHMVDGYCQRCVQPKKTA